MELWKLHAIDLLMQEHFKLINTLIKRRKMKIENLKKAVDLYDRLTQLNHSLEFLQNIPTTFNVSFALNTGKNVSFWSHEFEESGEVLKAAIKLYIEEIAKVTAEIESLV